MPKADRARVAAKAEAIRSGGILPASPGPGLVSAGTILFFIPTAAFAVTGFASDERVGPVWFFFAILFFIFFAVFLLLDATTVPPKRRTTPEQAVRAFYGSIQRRRYGRAYACVSPLDRTSDPRSTVPITLLAVHPRPFGFDRAVSFGKYWRAQAGLDDRFVGGYHKHLRHKLVRVETVRPGVARATVELRVRGYPSATGCLFLIIGILVVAVMMALTKEQVFAVEKLLYEKDGLWWMANGELGDAEDRALADALLSN
ncbi:MAG TPA: hypothetical protein VEJ18_05100 [Planctomycetota bacterium]|nr:hypothetical protein [Planctomycetota bacterium]